MVDQDMELIVITGASAGIGAEAAVALAQRGFAVLGIGRSELKLAQVYDRMRAVSPSPERLPVPLAIDLSSLAGVRQLAASIHGRRERLTALVNNAGIQPAHRRTSEDGFELTFAVNHLAPFLLTNLLAERLRADGGRVITTASSNHAAGQIDFSDLQMERGWRSGPAYDRSKLANVLFTMALPARTGLPATSFHPGSVTTELNRESFFYRLEKLFERFVYLQPAQGAQTLIWLAVSTEGGAPKGPYYVNCAPAPMGGQTDPELADRLWEASERLVGISHRRSCGVTG
jgi:NAD(P)-dependent dehydrogenase (short-subunit alcohol dehydrogenase family)